MYSIKVELTQRVLLERNPSMTGMGIVWRATGAIGIVGASNLSEVRGLVKNKIDEFINAYLAANPK